MVENHSPEQIDFGTLLNVKVVHVRLTFFYFHSS